MIDEYFKPLLISVLANLIFITSKHFSHAALTGQCNKCFTSTIACLDEQNFATCVDDRPVSMRTPCPKGTVCTADKAICQATAHGALPVCYEDQCGICASAQKNFACLDEAIYAICYDGQKPEPSSIEYCSEGYVCDLKNPKICSPALTAIPSCTVRPTTHITTVAKTDTTTDATTHTTTDTPPNATTDTTTTIVTTTYTTTGSTRPPRDATTFCAEMSKQGKFRQDGDTTCSKYIYCYRLAGQYLGRKYVCHYYFNAATQECQTDRPDDC